MHVLRRFLDFRTQLRQITEAFFTKNSKQMFEAAAVVDRRGYRLHSWFGKSSASPKVVMQPAKANSMRPPDGAITCLRHDAVRQQRKRRYLWSVILPLMLAAPV